MDNSSPPPSTSECCSSWWAPPAICYLPQIPTSVVSCDSQTHCCLPYQCIGYMFLKEQCKEFHKLWELQLKTVSKSIFKMFLSDMVVYCNNTIPHNCFWFAIVARLTTSINILHVFFIYRIQQFSINSVAETDGYNLNHMKLRKVSCRGEIWRQIKCSITLLFIHFTSDRTSLDLGDFGKNSQFFC